MTTPATGTSLPTQQVVGVSGTHLTLNGTNWLPRGVTLQALVRPSAALMADGTAAQIAAINNYGVAELNAIKTFGADTIRFQISQPSLDPNSPLYDAGYLSEVINAVNLARQNDLVVMLMMQDEAISGETDPHPLATAETQGDWDLLNATFGSDRGVLYELYNEPELQADTPANWTLWANGDPNNTSTVAPGAVGMQTMINHLRSEGSQNVFVLDGLDFAHTLGGVPTITDPLNRVVYAVHPYPDGSADESAWDPEFGIPSQTLPVWADEWSAATGQKIGLGTLPNYQVAVDFLNYIRLHSIPICAGAFDIPNFMVQDVPGWTYTNYNNFSDANQKDDAGQLVHKLFSTDYGQALTDADGL